MRLPFRLAPAALALLLLQACNGEKQKAEEQRTAVGQILPGSASDAMLPYETLRSQPPLAPQTEGNGKSKGADAATGAAAKSRPAPADDAAPATPAADPPAAAATPEPE